MTAAVASPPRSLVCSWSQHCVHTRAPTRPRSTHRFAEYLDVVQTRDGSVWKGLGIEQTPNVAYEIATADGSVHVIKAADVVKITKQRNKHITWPRRARARARRARDGAGCAR
jgi:hypothetical protein